METTRKEQIEALEALLHFNDKLVKNMEILSDELSGVRLSDTDKLLQSVIDGMNWEIQILGATLDLINEEEIRVDKEQLNEGLAAFSKAYQHKNDLEMALVLHRLSTVFEDIGTAASKTVQSELVLV